ncbi:MAG: dTDP-glucose 4,6-dehydratase [Candidatus Glassbacteria bacterium RIFCSPLOWO2_12_FULL_58_11]|uniref:dTDP-glucose 4,6-dehydratase n=1 Tax=Candidatus Glassbacteria bacterium RIFCSPLOWO2_12_FULL_58_11 TaxID=1817867 RepID=A0A1F5YJV6_9BACT|nr:MAG: dTDP-glucose 4,6-dehydratase [Candidatus Glassbacteria bacterium RIFCSPLOWO2_12_FULL_58_11]
MKLLVTGGAGFIGSNFVLHMLRTYPELDLVNVDKLTYAGNLENLKSLEGDKRHRFIKLDIGDSAAIERLVGAELPDAVVNFAAESHVDRSIEGPEVFLRTNVLGTLSLLEACRKAGTPVFLQIGTDEVYGSLGEAGSFTEQSPLQPNSPYAASKAGADHLVRAYGKTYGMDVRITRCSNNYGPFQFPEKLIPLMLTNALEGRPLPVYGDGLNVRDWIFVTDHCRALDLVLQKGKPGEIYNIGGVAEKTNLEVVKTILAAVEADQSLIRFVEDRPGHDRRYAIDSSRLRGELGWVPEVDFGQGIALTVRWYREHESWWRRIKSGEYRQYYEKMYGKRL